MTVFLETSIQMLITERDEYQKAAVRTAVNCKAENDKLLAERDALMAAVQSFHTWAYSQRKQQSKGGHASFDYMELRDQMDIADAALKQAGVE